MSVGEWRSLVARFVRDEEVPGSNPGSPTISFLSGVNRFVHLPEGMSYFKTS